jgi:hypothetical protein
LVGPSELPVQQRNLKKTEVINEIVEGGGLSGVDVPIGLVTRGSNEVEVTQKGDRSREGGKDLLEGGEEDRLVRVGARTVDIDNGKQEVIGAMRESGGDGKLINGVVSEFKKTVIPGCNYTS